LLVAFEYVAVIREIISELHQTGLPPDKIEAIVTYLSFFVGYLVDRNSKLCSWNAHRGDSGTTFDRSVAIFPRVFVERSPHGLMEAWLASVGPSIETAASVPSAVTVYQGDASSLPFEADSFDAIVTDPPYYDAIPYTDLGAFFWAWESMIPCDSPPVSQDAPGNGEVIETRRGDDPNIYRARMLRAFKEVYRVLKPGRKFCLIFSGKVTGSFEEYVDLCQQAGLELVDVKRVPEEERTLTEDAKQITYVIYLRKPSSRPMREPLQAAEASSLLDAVAAGKPVLYSGLAELIAQELPEVDIAEILPAGGRGATIEQFMEVLADEDPRELLEKLFSKRELRELAKELNAGTALDAAINPIKYVLSQYGFRLPSASKKIDGATQVRQNLRGMQGKISQAIEKADIRGAFVEGCTGVERLLRRSIWGWAQLVFRSDRDSQLLRALQEEYAGERCDLNRLSAGHIISLFRRLPDAIAMSPMAPMIERKFGRRHVYLPSNKKTKFADRLGEVFEYRNKVEHDKDGYWTTITPADAREELASVLARAEQLLLDLVDARAIPRVAEPIRETRDKWDRKSYLLSMDDGIDLVVRSSSPLTLGATYLYFGSEINPRPVDPLVLSFEELDTIP
jgi:SAM-dependent methyltransferase